MFRVHRVRGFAVWAFLLCSTTAFAASYTSTQSGNWNSTATWGGAGVPGSGDNATITSSHTVTVTDARVVLDVTLDSVTGNKMLVIDSTGSLLVESAAGPAVDVNAPVPGNTSIVRINGGLLETSGVGIGIRITGGATTAAKLEFTPLGGTARFDGDVAFSGTAANALIDFGTSSGTVEIGGDLGNGGTFVNSSTSTVEFNGTGPQTINSYTFNHFKVNKNGTATLNGPITVNGNFTVMSSGVLDDGGNQISLNGGGTSAVTMSGGAVLKLGSAASATVFPSPAGSTTLGAGNTVVYQAGVAQTINTAVTYPNLWLSTMGAATAKTLSGTPLQVTGQLDIWDNGVNTVTLNLAGNTLDLDGSLSGDGAVSMTTGAMTIGGNFPASASLTPGSGTVTYDGTGPQSVLATTYNNLVVNKASGIATLGGNAGSANLTVASGTLDLGANTVALTNGLTIFGPGTLVSSLATLQLAGSSLQTIATPAPLTFATLTVTNPNGATFGVANVTVNNTLNLNGGTLTGNFFVDVLATVNRSAGWIIGTLGMGMNPTPARRFHVGTAASYLPVDVDAGSAGTLTIRANEGKSPDRTFNNVLDRYWSITAGTVVPIDVITFNYNQSDVVTGDETKYILASYDSGSFTFTHYGDVDDVNNNVTASNLTGYIQDWIIGQPGSLAAASQLAIIDVNSGTDPNASSPFDVVVEARDDGGTPTPVFDPTGISLSVAIGSGTLGGTTTGTIAGGSDNTTISGVTYSPAENNVTLGVARTSGDILTNGTSATFNVLAAPSTLTVTSINDSGAGTLRDAITTANSGGCTSPCTIDFSTSGQINLATALPAITVSDLTIDGYTAPGASANTNAYGQPSNAVITLAINGGGSVNFGFDVQETFVKIKGFAIKNFTNAGVLFSGDNSGSNVSGCYIGTDTTGSITAPNATGVHFSGSTEASAGGMLPAERNVISGNTTYGIFTDSAANTIGILGNYIGTKADLSGALANGVGVKVCSGCSVSLGTTGVGNVVSGNIGSGIVLAGNGTTVLAHYIGLAGSGGTAIANATGIQIDAGASFNVIGGASPSDINYIGGNTQNGILVRGDDNTIDNNWIGVAPDGTTPRGNGGSGVRIENTGSRNLVGTTSGNKLVFNVNGATIADTGIGNAIRRGKVAGNSNRGIDLGDNGTTANDATDADTGPNNLQNFPAIAEAKYNAGNVDVKLSLNSSGGVNVNFVVFDVYKADASTPAQALEYLGNSGCLAGNVFSNLIFSVPAGTAVVGNNIVATATAYSDAGCSTPSEGTSELSAAARIGGDIHWIAGTGNWETAANWNPATVPTSADTAYIDNTGTYTVTINSIANVWAVHVGSVSGAQTLAVASGQSLNLNGGTSSVGTTGILTFDGIGINTGINPLTVTGTFNWNIGSITGAGGVTLASGATMNIATASGKALNAGSLTVGSGATVNWLGGPINMLSAGFIDNFGLFEAKTDSTISDAGSAGTFDNAGTFRKSTTAGSTTFTNIVFNHTAGTVDLQTGTLNVANGTASAPFTISSGAVLLIDGDTYTFNTGAGVTGLGKVHVNGGTLAVNGPSTTIEHLQLDLGTLGGTGSVLSGANTWQWNGGTMSGGGSTVIGSGGSLVIGTASSKALNNRTLTTQGSSTTTVTGTGNIDFSNGASLNNAGSFNTTVDVTLSDAGSDGGITNSGTFQKSGGAGATVLTNIDLVNSGTIIVTTGTLNPGNITNTGAIQLNTGTLLIDNGIVDLNSGSNVSGTGLLRIAGGTLTHNENSDTLPNVQLDSGILNGVSTFDITTLVWNSGSMSGAGTTNIPAGGTATFATASAKGLQRTFSIANGGTASFTGTGSINMSAGGNFVNDGTMDVTAAVIFGDAGGAGDIFNTRTFRSNHAGTTSLTGITLDSSTASGQIDVQNGILDLADGTNSASILIGSTGTLLVNSDSYTLATGTTVGGTGTLSLTGGTLNVTGPVSIPQFSQNGGTVDGSGTLTLSNSATWQTGSMQGGGTTTVGSGATLNLTTPSAKALNNRTLSSVAGGNINLTGVGTINLSNGANIANAGTMLLSVDNTFNNGGAAGDLVNTGTLRKQSATGPTALTGIGLQNTGGLVDIQSGTIGITSDTFTQTAAGTLKVWLNGTTPGTGFGQLSSSASVNLAGTLEVALVGPYQPIGGDTFRVLAAPAHVSDFTQPYTYPVLANSRTFSDAYDGSGLLLTVNGNADLSIAKSAPANVLAGGAIAYTLTVNNAGPDVANTVSVTDTLQTGHTSISASGTGWTCNVVSLTVTCTAATLTTGAAPSITINANAPVTPQTFTNVANVTSANDSNGANNSGSAGVTVGALQAEVEISSLSPVGPVAQSTPFTFTFVIQNHGPQTASNVVFTAPIPSTLTFNGAVPDAGSCNFSAGTLTCNVGSILNGATLEIDVNLTTTTTAGTQTVTGSVTAVESDPNPGNNSIVTPVEVSGGTITVTNTNDAGMGSLREALDDAGNGTCTLPCTINFNIAGAGPHLIQPVADLPAVQDQTTVDATTQPGYAGIPLVRIDGQSSLVYGLRIDGDSNVVRGFSITGFTDGFFVDGSNNTIEANYVGLDTLGNAAGNIDGFRIAGNGNVVGGTTAAQRNVISGNGDVGVYVDLSAANTVIRGNYIGTDPSGTSARPNTSGVGVIDEASATTIGGAAAAEGNVISGNSDFGVYVEGSGGSVIAGSPSTHSSGVVDGTVIRNNRVGTNAGGTAALANGVTGIAVDENVTNTLIQENVVSGNQNGVTFSDSTVDGVSLADNLIGVAPDGTTAMGNPTGGVIVTDGLNITISGNTIAHNGANGIALLGGQGTKILGNSIHSNTLLGVDIEFDGVTPNDATDADTGANGRQNFPALTSALLLGGGDIAISSTIDSSGSPAGVGSILVEYFEADPSGEGVLYLGNACVAGNAFGLTTSFNAPTVAVGDAIVSNATSYTDSTCTIVADGTSEFSNVVTAANCTPPAVTITGPTQMCAGGSVTLDAGAGFDSYLWSTGATTRTILVSPASTQGYSVTVKDSIGCPNSDSHTVTVNTPPTVTITGPTSMCAGGNVTLDAGLGFASYLWSTGATTQTITVSPASTQAYSVTVSDGTCNATDSHTVTVNALPAVTITGPTSVCTGGSVTLDAGAGFASYLWSNGATSQTITVSPGSTQSYSVTVSNGTCSASDSHNVTVTANPTVPIAAPPAVCESSTGNAASVASQPGATYNWTISNGTITSGAGTNAIVFTAGPSGTVSLGITVTAASCVSTGSANVPIVAPPVVAITGPASACAGTNVTLDAGAGFGSYLWSTGATTQSIVVAVNATQTYSVTVSNVPGCSTTDTHTVTMTPAPSAVIDAPSPVQPNQSGLAASVASQPGATYAWSITNGSITSGNGTNAIVFKSGASGITHLHVTVTLGGCSTSFTQAVFIEGTTPTGEADLGVTKSAPASVQAGAAIAYTIGVRNFGPGAASNVVITDTLPTGTTFVTMNTGSWNCARSGSTITCTGNAAAGANSTITVIVNAPQTAGIVTNVVHITSATTDPNGANNTANASTNVVVETPTCPAAPPSLLLPVDGASLISPVLFSWSGVTGATEYELWIDNALQAVTGTTSLSRPLPSGTFSWFVVARFANGCDPLASAPRTVTVQESGNCSINTAPQLRSPSNGSTVGSPTTFIWTASAQAIGYRVWIEANGTAAQDAGTTTGTSLSVALPPGAIVAYVDALFSGCPPVRSAPVQLTVPKPNPCADRTTAQPLSPANGAVVNTSAVEFTWTEAAGADGYRVWYSLDGAAPAVLGSTTSDTSLKAAIGRGTVAWYVETLHDGCASTESQTSSFLIPTRNECSQQKPETLTPANNTSVNNATVQFAWSGVPNAVSYELWAAVDNGSSVLLGKTQGTSLIRTVPAGKIDWFVRAIVDRCGARDSQKSRFTFTAPDACRDNDRPLLVSPLGGASVSAPVRFDWNNVNAVKYEVFVLRGDAAPQLVATTAATEVSGLDLAPGKVRWFVRAHFGDTCGALDSAERRLEIVPAPAACVPLAAPVVSAPGQISTGVPFLIQWTPVNGATAYQVLIADNANFTGAAISTVTAPELLFQAVNETSQPILRFIRVRAIDGRCQPTGISAYGPAHVLFILPKASSVGSGLFGGGNLSLELELGPQYAGQSFTATPKQAWISVTPANGVVPAGGIKLAVTADTSTLPVGTTIGSIAVSLSSAGRGVGSHDTGIALPLGVSLVTPVMPTPANTPPPDALIIPAVAHADGINSHFQSDVRVSNTSAQFVTYQLTFVPSGASGITQGQQTTFSIEPGRTIALDDILKSWFSTGAGGVIGTLEIRPLTELTTSTPGTAFTGLANLTSFASSRTFNITSNGTFGQYIPAVPFANFIGSQRILSLQQIAQSSRYRTNLGIVEGSGDPVSLLVRMFGEGGQQLGQFPLSLNGGQHIQLNAFLLEHGVDNLNDGRVEIEVVSDGGKVTAYASVLDNKTSDPLLVTPVEIHSAGATKWVVPGVADLATGSANWQTDLRVFNAGTEDVEAGVAFYSQNGGAPKTTTITIPAGQVRQFDKALTSLFGASNDGGAVHISTPTAARLIATARTYNQVGAGTYGQFISGVTPNEAAGVENRPLQLLQVEETDRYRSNIGLVEVTGNPVRLEISAVPPDTKFTAVTELILGANEFRQLGSLLRSMGLADTHNARVTVRVLDGTGRVTAYASVIDMLTNDPTYIPAQ